MKSALVAAGLGLAMLSAPVALRADDDDDERQRIGSLTVPITSVAGVGTGKFTGEFRINEFAARNNNVYAVGVLIGTVSDLNNVAIGTVIKNVAIPVARNATKTTANAAAIDNTVINAATCEILNLVLGPLDLNLLGLRLQLNRVVLELDAVSGPGNLLGNLLCAVANLLNGTQLGQLVAALNNLLGLLTRL